MAVKLIDELQKEIKAAGEAVTQEAYEKAYDHVFQILDNLEKLLNDNRYLEGNEITEEDKKVVNNDYHHLTNHFEIAFKPLHKKGAPDLYPEELREEIDKLNVWLFENVNNAVYRAQFAESLQAFKDGYETFFAGLEAMDKRLENQRFLFGDYITDSDIRLYTTLARFDYSYSRNIGPCVHRLVDYKNLWPYARDLYQIPAFRHNTYFKDFAASEDLTHAPEDYWENVYYDIVVQETDWDTIWSQPTGREALSKDPAHKWKAEI